MFGSKASCFQFTFLCFVLGALLCNANTVPSQQLFTLDAELELESETKPIQVKLALDLLDASISELQDALQRRQITSLELVRAYKSRISEVNSYTRSIIEVNPAAERDAEAADTARELLSSPRGPLHGIPILVKDNIAAAAEDGLNTTAGSFALLGSVPHGDAAVVRNLKEAGAIILGKANMCEWANGRGNVTFGWSARGGQTMSPFLNGGNPCGSSSGSAVASTLGLAAASLGTETGWSITCPSSRNNVVGIKPTRGLTSRHMIVPLILERDTVGPIAKTVADAAILLQVMAGKDQNDEATIEQPDEVPDYTANLKADALKGANIGVLRLSDLPVNKTTLFMDMVAEQSTTPEEAYERLDWAASVVKELGANVTDSMDLSEDNLDRFAAFFSNSTKTKLLYGYSFNSGLETYFASLKTNTLNITTVQDIITFNLDHKELELPDQYDDQSSLMKATEVTKSDEVTYLASLQELLNLTNSHGLENLMDSHNLDALVTILGGGEPIVFTATAGLPIVTVPLGFYSNETDPQPVGSGTVYPGPNMPYGLLFIGRRWSEQKLLGYAYAFEQATKVREQGRERIIPEALPKSGI